MERIYELSRRRLAVAALLSTGLPVLLSAGVPLEDVQKSATEWAQVRSEAIRIESDWKWERSLMQGTLDALQERVRQLEERRAALELKTTGARQEMANLEEQKRAMGAATDEALRLLRELDERLLRMRPLMPPRLSAALELPFRSVGEPDLGVAERMQHTMAILNRCAHFNSTITRGEELVVVPDGSEKLLEVVYFGAGHGYALDRVAGVAYSGAPAEAGWVWAPVPELTKAVDRLLAVAADQTEPVFVALPLQVSGPSVLEEQSQFNTP